MDIALAPPTARTLWLLGLTPLADCRAPTPLRSFPLTRRLSAPSPADVRIGKVERNAVSPEADAGDILSTLGILPGIVPPKPAPVAVPVEPIVPRASTSRRTAPIVVAASEVARVDALFDAVPAPAAPKRSLRVFEWGGVAQAVEDAGSNGCRWPVGDPRSTVFSYCGKRREGTRSYCPDHCVMAYMPARSSRPVSGPRFG